MKTPINLKQVQAIQLDAAPGGIAPLPRRWKTLRRVRAGTDNSRHYGPTARKIGPVGAEPTSCGPLAEVVARHPDFCEVRRPKTNRESVEAVAAGVAEGLRRAPLLSTSPAPWTAPNFRGTRFPQTAVIALSTFATTNVRTAQVQAAMAGYLGTTNYPVTAILATAGSPVEVISFRCPDSYVSDGFVVACQDHEFLYQAKWTATVNGKLVAGPFALVGGKAPLNVQAKRDETVAINCIPATGDSFSLGLEVLVNGWTYPSLASTDGTYDRVLRKSPNWLREEGV